MTPVGRALLVHAVVKQRLHYFGVMSLLDRSQYFDSVYVIQFLGAADSRRTGEELFHGTIKPLAARVGVHSTLLDVSNRPGFLRALDLVAEECRKGGHAPILHFETHGSKQGLHADLTERIGWQELKPHLVAINKISRMNLVVTLAACHGLQLLQTLFPIDRAPVWGLIGPDDQVLPTDVANGFRRYYEVLLTEVDHNKARDALVQADASNADTWKRQNAEAFLGYMYGEYQRRESTPEKIQRRLDDMVATLILHGKATVASSGALRRKLRAQLEDNEPHFLRIKSHFLMLDLFPENEARFPTTFKEATALHAKVRGLMDL